MRICSMCQGKGKFEAVKIEYQGKTIEVPEMKCHSCDGKGYIGADQEGVYSRQIIGGIKW